MGPVHVRHPYRSRRHGAVQRLAGRRDAPRRSGRSHRPLPPRGGRVTGREAPAGYRDQGKISPALPHAVTRAPDGAGWRRGLPRRRAGEDPARNTKTKDITGGLPRVVELFEARKPHETAIISEIDGVVKFGEVSKGQRKLYVVADNGTEKEYSVPKGVHINVQEGERMKAGE